MSTIAVGWLEGEPGKVRKQRWCRALRKTTTTYADNVKTKCGYWVTMPCGISAVEAVDCEECLAKEPPL